MSNMEDRIMQKLKSRYLEKAQRERRFFPQRSHYYLAKIRDGHLELESSAEQTHDGKDTSFCFWQKPFSQTWEYNIERQCILNCIFQPTRPPHVSGRPDYLPFTNLDEVLAIFNTLRLPSSYFQIASGTAGSAHWQTFESRESLPSRYELIAHCVSKQGDWALALSHDAAKMVTSVFWSVDARIDQHALIGDLQEFLLYGSHPMLIPCIMFAANLQLSEQRRHSIKDRLQKLETTIRQISETEAFSCDHKAPGDDSFEGPQSLEALFQVLHSCRKDQSSRKGRYGFWRSFVEAIEEGFQYFERLMLSTDDVHLSEANRELRAWVALTDRKLESLMARDEDHVHRVDNVSHMLYSLVEQRDLRVQSKIARSAQQDSEDMKFIAVLGSFFLPASLVASILNVPEFQFAAGATLFGAYLGITIPLIVLVLILCMARTHLGRLSWDSSAFAKRRAELRPKRIGTVVSSMSD